MAYRNEAASPQALEALEAALPTGVLENPAKVIDYFEVTRPLLPEAGLAHDVPFDGIYGDLTQKVKHGLDIGVFTQPQAASRAVPTFYDYYRTQLTEHAKGNPGGVNPVWQPLFYHPAAKRAPRGIQFLLGMNAHINYDLAQALRDTQADNSYYHDFEIIVGDMIDATAREISSAYIPGPSRLRDKLTALTISRIAMWRERAWNSGMYLQEVQNDPAATAAELKRMERFTLTNSRLILHGGSLALDALGISDHIKSKVVQPNKA